MKIKKMKIRNIIVGEKYLLQNYGGLNGVYSVLLKTKKNILLKDILCGYEFLLSVPFFRAELYKINE